MPDAADPHSLPTEVRSEIRKQAVQQVAKTTVAAAVGLVAIAGAGWFFYLKDQLPLWVSGVPGNAVVAFDGRCPKGWSAFDDGAGRFILGAGQGKGLKERLLRATGGKEEHALTEPELPKHAHRLFAYQSSAENGHLNLGLVQSDYFTGRPLVTAGDSSRMTGEAGEGKAHEIMPPFIALNYCKKDG